MAVTKERIQQITDEMFAKATVNEPELDASVLDATDLFQENINARFEMGKKQFPKGSSKRVRKFADDVALRLAVPYRRARDDSEVLKKRGDKQRARMVVDQYMEEQFLPAVEALILLTNVDEVLNSKDTLSLLDDYVLMESGSGAGYTRSYIESLYDKFRGQKQGMSDHDVMKSIGKIRKLIERDEVRTAIALANKIKDKIDAGENQASDEDYDIIATVVARGQ